MGKLSGTTSCAISEAAFWLGPPVCPLLQHAAPQGRLSVPPVARLRARAWASGGCAPSAGWHAPSVRAGIPHPPTVFMHAPQLGELANEQTREAAAFHAEV
ncbi:hypothetical protein EGR_00746 [Echinococcus granulosus]|uniref:Uncharacterized protein n=1 Tax=Echinococcus granulosus TaxID=6210 RepID=W6V050_ECHGR|nr:hypothetical protein EGR_00746 [Echinococcus granulosus]EUB64202.1 hypothetical protein EGR_00746 [Echinococcus granulosus]